MRYFADNQISVIWQSLNLDAEKSALARFVVKPTNPNIGAELTLAENFLVVP